MRSASDRTSSRSSVSRSTAAPNARELSSSARHRLDRPDVEAARRRRGHEHARCGLAPTGQLACDEHLLGVAARQHARRRVGTRRLDVEASDHGPRVGRGLAPVDEEAALAGQQQVLGDREGRRQPGAQTVLGNERDSGRARSPRSATGHVGAVDFDPASCRSQHAGDELSELALPIARDTGDADDLARADFDRDVVDPRVFPVEIRHAGEPQQRPARRRRRATRRQVDVAADHHPREITRVVSVVRTAPVTRPLRMTVTRSDTSMTSPSL